MTDVELQARARHLRRMCVQAASRSGSSHIGGVLSMIDLLTCLYYDAMAPADRFVLSKGHTALGLYAVLRDLGVISEELFNSYHADGSPLIGHPNHFVEGIDVSTGSLGHGPAVAAGLALGLRADGGDARVYCLLGDGECQEGSVWEALVFIASHALDNLTLIIDANGWQGFTDPAARLLPRTTLAAMARATGLDFEEIDGHDISAIRIALARRSDRARVVLARTTKGKGVSFMEDRFEWHYKSPTPDELSIALAELE